ncbi:hypothetical protein P3S67_016111 [Capsicum chacoense]
MNITLPEMLHNITSNGGNESTKLSVLDRQRARIKWQEEQVNGQQMSYFSIQNDQLMNCFHQSSEAQQFHGLINLND